MLGAPPPPPPPPPPLSLNIGGGGRDKPSKPIPSKLLSEIHQGTKLKKTATNDRSAPLIPSSKDPSLRPSKPAGAISNGNGGIVPRSQQMHQAATAPGALGGLFPNGVPRKPSDLKNNAAQAVAAPPVPQQKGTCGASQSLKPQMSQSGLGQKPNTPPKLSAPTRGQSLTSSSGMSDGIRELTSKIENGLNGGNRASPPSPPPLPPTKIKPNLPSFPPAVKPPASSAASSNGRPAQFQTLQRPSPQRDSPSGAANIRKSGSSEKLTLTSVKPPNAAMVSRRPAAPPPPPPTAASHQPHHHQPSAHRQDEVVRRQTAITTPQQPPPSIRSNGPSEAPPPPPRNSSCIDSMEQRFHFLPLNELPQAMLFTNSRKEYDQCARSKQQGASNHF